MALTLACVLEDVGLGCTLLSVGVGGEAGGVKGRGGGGRGGERVEVAEGRGVQEGSMAKEDEDEEEVPEKKTARPSSSGDI